MSLLSVPILRYSLFYTAAPIRLPWTRAGVIGFKLSRERVSPRTRLLPDLVAGSKTANYYSLIMVARIL